MNCERSNFQQLHSLVSSIFWAYNDILLTSSMLYAMLYRTSYHIIGAENKGSIVRVMCTFLDDLLLALLEIKKLFNSRLCSVNGPLQYWFDTILKIRYQYITDHHPKRRENPRNEKSNIRASPTVTLRPAIVTIMWPPATPSSTCAPKHIAIGTHRIAFSPNFRMIWQYRISVNYCGLKLLPLSTSIPANSTM